MSDFQEKFFKDLRRDVQTLGFKSILCDYFREEKRQHILIQVSKCIYEHTVLYGPESTPLHLLKETSEYKKAMERKTKSLKNKNSSRKASGEHACTEILCSYYDFLTAYLSSYKNPDSLEFSQCISAFLDELYQKAENAKVSRRIKQTVLDKLATTGKQNILNRAESLVQHVMNLYLYAEADQFLYNAGYPLSQYEDSDNQADTNTEQPTPKQARIKTIPLKLLDYYFSRKDSSFNKLSSISRMSPSWILTNEESKEKLEDVYQFACDSELDTAVIPLLIDNDSGSGLYVLGRNYLQGWSDDNREQKKVDNILGNRSCCYAIIKFLNMELDCNGKYVWSPYSTIDAVYGKCDTNPEEILFNDLEIALNIYNGHLSVSSNDILYENFQNENMVFIDDNAVSIEDEFKKYFKITNEADYKHELKLKNCIEEVQLEYNEEIPNKFSSK